MEVSWSLLFIPTEDELIWWLDAEIWRFDCCGYQNCNCAATIAIIGYWAKKLFNLLFIANEVDTNGCKTLLFVKVKRGPVESIKGRNLAGLVVIVGTKHLYLKRSASFYVWEMRRTSGCYTND